MDKETRKAKVAKLIQDLNIKNQDQLMSWLIKSGTQATQASISRDLKDLGAVKVGGFYRLPEIGPGQSKIVRKLRAECSGGYMIVFKTDPLHAPVLAALIDRSKIAGVVGTIAGDDTVFAALSDPKFQRKAIRQVVALIQGKGLLHD